jgi:hypothetical protein
MSKTEKRRSAAERNCHKIQEHLWERDRYELVAEKSAELGHAAIKVLRADCYSDNGIEMSGKDAHEMFEYGVIELLMAVKVLGYDLDELTAKASVSAKWGSWYRQMMSGVQDVV